MAAANLYTLLSPRLNYSATVTPLDFKDDISWKLVLNIEPDKFKKQTELHKHTLMTILSFVPRGFYKACTHFHTLAIQIGAILLTHTDTLAHTPFLCDYL